MLTLDLVSKKIKLRYVSIATRKSCDQVEKSRVVSRHFHVTSNKINSVNPMTSNAIRCRSKWWIQAAVIGGKTMCNCSFQKVHFIQGRWQWNAASGNVTQTTMTSLNPHNNSDTLTVKLTAICVRHAKSKTGTLLKTKHSTLLFNLLSFVSTFSALIRP